MQHGSLLVQSISTETEQKFKTILMKRKLLPDQVGPLTSHHILKQKVEKQNFPAKSISCGEWQNMS